jgi:hypothetical protein
VTDRSPYPVYAFALGTDRYPPFALRADATYVLLMCDEYPPFRLDMSSWEPPAGPRLEYPPTNQLVA